MQINIVNRHLVLECHSHTGYQPDLRHKMDLTKSEAQILDFLLRQFKKKTKYCKEKDDFLWVKCDQANVAKMTDCSLRTVGRAYKKFRELGFLIMETIERWRGGCRYWVSMKWDRLKELLPFSDFKTPLSAAEKKTFETPPIPDILSGIAGHFVMDTPIYNNLTSKEEKEDTKMDPLPETENSSSSSGENQSPVKYMVETWNEMATRIKIQTVDYDYLDDKDYQNALTAYEEYGQKGWDSILEIYEGSRFLRGKTGREGAAPFSFHAVVNPKIVSRILGGGYSGGLEEYNKVCAAGDKEVSITMADLTFDANHPKERRRLAEFMGAPTYKSLIVNGGVNFSFYGDVLRLDCSQFVYDKLELLHKKQLLESFAVNTIEKRFCFYD